MPGGGKCFEERHIGGKGVGGVGIANLYPIQVVRTGLAGHVEFKERPEGRETVSHVTISGKSLRTDGSARAKVLRQEHDCVQRKSQVVRTVGQSRCRDTCADERNSRAGSHGARRTQEGLEGWPHCGVFSRPAEKTAGTTAGAGGWKE